jgi:membrane protease YdiL (CAAX protease family)
MMVTIFFLLTFIVSWSLWALAAAIAGGTLSPPGGLSFLGRAVSLAGVVAPAIVALAVTAIVEGRAAALRLARQAFQGAAGARWYVFAIGYIIGIRLAAALVQWMATGALPAFGTTPLFVMALGIIVSTPVQAGEEIGWRGYALPRLSARVGLAPASSAIGAVWACWHLPLFFIPGTDTTGQSFPVYLLNVTALSVAMAWLYWRTSGGLLLTMLMHAAVNNTRDIVPSPAVAGSHPFAVSASMLGWLTTALLWAGAAYFLARMRRATLQPGRPAHPESAGADAQARERL